jgi:hypothetical protein
VKVKAMARTTSRTALAIALCSAVFLAPARARADTLVFPVEGADSATNARLTRALVAGADSEKPRLADTPLGEAASLLECNAAERACLDSMAQAMEASALLSASVRPAGAKLAARITFHSRGQAPQTRDVELPSEPEAGASLLERNVRALLRGEGPVVEASAPPPARASTGARTDAGVVGAAGPESPPGFAFQRVRLWSWGIAGSGLVLVGVGAVFAVKANGLESDVESAPRETVADFEHLKNLEDEGDSATALSKVLLIGGGLAVLAGAALIVWQGTSPTAEERGRALTLSPAALRGGAGLVLSGELP